MIPISGPAAGRQPTFSLIPPGSKSPKEQSTFQKLVHINTTALLEHPDYKGPFLPASAVALSPSSSSKKMTPLQKELQETLKTLLGSTDQGSLEVVTQYGWVLGKGSLLLGKGLKLTGPLSKPCMAQQGPGELQAPAPSAYLCVHCGVSKASLQVLIPPPAPVLPQMQRCSWMPMATFCPRGILLLLTLPSQLGKSHCPQELKGRWPGTSGHGPGKGYSGTAILECLLTPVLI